MIAFFVAVFVCPAQLILFGADGYTFGHLYNSAINALVVFGIYILINIVIVVASIMASMASLYYYYCISNISIPFHSDDAGSTFALMDDKFFLGK